MGLFRPKASGHTPQCQQYGCLRGNWSEGRFYGDNYTKCVISSNSIMAIIPILEYCDLF